MAWLTSFDMSWFLDWDVAIPVKYNYQNVWVCNIFWVAITNNCIHKIATCFFVVALLQLLPLQPLISLLKLKSHQLSNVISHKKICRNLSWIVYCMFGLVLPRLTKLLLKDTLKLHLEFEPFPLITQKLIFFDQIKNIIFYFYFF